VGFAQQLEELGRAHSEGDGTVVVPWESVYWALSDEDLCPTRAELPIPPVDGSVVPALKSTGTLSDPNFQILVSGWHRRRGGRLTDALDLVGPVSTHGVGGVAFTLSEPVYALKQAVTEFQRRTQSDRSAHANKLAWAQIRNLAVEAEAVLDSFLRHTVVLRPRMLGISMERVHVGEDTAVRVTPTFAGSPSRWLEHFDKSKRTDAYKIIENEGGYVEVIVDEVVQQVLREMKTWPGRIVSGERARRLTDNPIAYFGDDLSQVFDPDAIADELCSLRDGAWAWRPAVDVQNERVTSAGIQVEALGDEASGQVDVRLFSSPAGLQSFLARLERAVDTHASYFTWSGLELEVGDRRAAHVGVLQQALAAWESGMHVDVSSDAPRPSVGETPAPAASVIIDASVVLDISRYLDRVDSIGVETPYGIISIPLGEKGAWLPEDAELRFPVEGGAGGSEAGLTMDRAELRAFVAAVREATDRGADSVPLPRGGHLRVDTARDLVDALPQSLVQDVDAERTNPTIEASAPTPRTGLLIKANIDAEDYVVKRVDVLAVPDGAVPLVPDALRDGVELKRHQLRGLVWLQHLYARAPEHCHGALLADDMGLGKTLQALALIARARQDDPDLEPAVVIAPVTLLENWAQEIERFFRFGSLPLVTLYGAELKSFRVRANDIDPLLRDQGLKRFLRPGWADGAAIVLSTYETLRDYEFSFGEVGWSIVICDEAQRIKNPNALVSRASKKLNARFCVAATGTPVENNLTDLWSLFDFIQPGLLEPLNRFNRTYRRPIEAKTDEDRQRVAQLRTIIDAQILRRTKADVATDLPAKVFDQRCRTLPMSGRQRQLYAAVIQAQHTLGAKERAGTDILQMISALRRICTDPRSGRELDEPLPDLASYRQIAPKLDWLITTLEQIHGADEKAIIFVDRKDIQRLLQSYIAQHFGFAPEIVNGETPTGGVAPDSRQRRIDRFQAKAGFNAMILSPVAAGVGLNIQEANHVIHYMRHWNPAKEDQATDRAYRIGQRKDVTVYTPTVVGDGWVSFDERLDELLEKKRAIAMDVLNGADDAGAAEFADLLGLEGAAP
jgi:hypothetical protein